MTNIESHFSALQSSLVTITHSLEKLTVKSPIGALDLSSKLLQHADYVRSWSTLVTLSARLFKLSQASSVVTLLSTFRGLLSVIVFVVCLMGKLRQLYSALACKTPLLTSSTVNTPQSDDR
ncbi:unnamed protein product [Sphenostylis stenocarpa]|uniref:Uncharacterized protein n=1 Tax=Sphenostylis stenocarpa TaxID=92480 RepID=A0AA86STP3_9FABA|nr:unnamed protein product [Sphenostylis stenocarpa]